MNRIINNLNKLEEYIAKITPPMSMEKLKTLISKAFPSREIFDKIYKEQPLLQNIMKSLIQFTQCLTMVSGGIKENVVPDRCEAVIDFRLLPGQHVNSIIDALKKIIKDLGYNIKEKISVWMSLVKKL